MENTLLIIHLAGAAIVGVLIVLSFLAVLLRKNERYEPLSVGVGLGGGFQLISGSLLALSSEGTLFSFCSKIGIYLGAIAVTHLVLYVAMKKDMIIFPTKLALSPVGVGGLASVISGAIIFIR